MIHIKKFFILFLLATMTIHCAPAQKKSPQSDQDQAITMVFSKNMPTISIHEQIIDQIYGAEGLNIAPEIVRHIQQAYCYLEFLTKVDMVKNDQNFARYKNDFKDFLQPRADNLPLRPTQKLVTSQGWQSITITSQDLINSIAWQLYIKSTICDIFNNDVEFIIDAAQTNHQIFSTIPNIEMAYATKDFTQFRLFEESLQIQALLQNEQRQRYLTQCADWNNLAIENIINGVNNFKQTDFYHQTHTQKPAEKKALIIASPMREQILLYFMFLYIQTTIYDSITQNNAFDILTQASSSDLAPNFFMYAPSDFIYIHDLLMVQNLSDTEKNKPNNPAMTIIMKPTIPEDLHKQHKEESIPTDPFGLAIYKAQKEKEAKDAALKEQHAQKRAKKMVASQDAQGSDVIIQDFFSDIGHNTKTDFTKFGNTLKDTGQTFGNVMLGGLKVFGTSPIVTTPLMGMMEGMAFLTDACTEGFIELSTELTYDAYSYAHIVDPSINPQQEANKVKAKLEKNRSTINIVMSVVIAIAIAAVIVVCTAGAGAMYAAYVGEAETGLVAGETAGTAATAGTEIGVSSGTSGAGAGATGTEAGTTTAATTTGTESTGVGAATSGTTTGTQATATTSSSAWEAFTAGVKSGIYSWGFLANAVMNIGFGVFSAMAAEGQDEAAALAAENEKESIQALWKFIEDNKANSVQAQNLFIDELHKKHQAAIANQTFGLQYYNNFLNGSVQYIEDQISQALAQQQVQMLTPDANGLVLADIGSAWGLQTPFVYLYPSQGFLSTTLGRQSFPYAQEVAQTPLASENYSNKQITSLNDSQPQATKLWFNQRAIASINQTPDQPLNVEIRFRILYQLDTAYHVGLYVGGNYHDYKSAAYLQSIQDQSSIDMDEAHLAKMLVIKRDDGTSAPSIGLYENEGLGWITQQPLPQNNIDTATVYHMSAQLNKNQLTVAFWPEDTPLAKWTKTMTVSPCDQRTFGVIFSGVAIEWGVVMPQQPIIQNKAVRDTSNMASEADRERASKTQWKQLLNPKFGTITLQSPGKQALLQGNYLYTTQSTNLVDADGNPLTDYIVFATGTDNVITNVGNNPLLGNLNVIVSLITGNVYNNSGKIIAHEQNALQAYTQINRSISQSLMNEIKQASTLYQQQLLKFTFGDYQLTAFSADAINSGFFIYTCPTSITQKNASGNPIIDYVIMADIVNNSLGSTVGMPPSPTIQGIISLITGNVYGRTSTIPIDSGYIILDQYTRQYGALPAAISDAIYSAINAYHAVTTQPQSSNPAPVNVIASQTMSVSDIINTASPSTGGVEIGLSNAAPANIIITNSSISQLQNSAAGSAKVQINASQPSTLTSASTTTGIANGTPPIAVIANASPSTTMPTTSSSSLIHDPTHALSHSSQSHNDLTVSKNSGSAW